MADDELGCEQIGGELRGKHAQWKDHNSQVLVCQCVCVCVSGGLDGPVECSI